MLNQTIIHLGIDSIATKFIIDDIFSVLNSENKKEYSKDHLFAKGCPEYIKNGHYKINDMDYMSVWALKKRFNLGGNTNSQNGLDAQEIFQKGVDYFRSKPDFGGFEAIYIYPVDDLQLFYGI